MYLPHLRPLASALLVPRPAVIVGLVERGEVELQAGESGEGAEAPEGCGVRGQGHARAGVRVHGGAQAQRPQVRQLRDCRDNLVLLFEGACSAWQTARVMTQVASGLGPASQCCPMQPDQVRSASAALHMATTLAREALHPTYPGTDP